MSSASRRKSKSVLTLSGKSIAAKLSKQKLAKVQQRQQFRAEKAKKGFRPTKAERGQFVFIGRNGKRNPTGKGRKGFLVYVTKSGKKQLIRAKGQKDYRPRTISSYNIPFVKKFKTAEKDFMLARLEKTSEGSRVVRGRGKVSVSGAWDFSDKVISSIAGKVRKTIEGQRSRRSFLIRANVLVEKSDGSTKVYEVIVPIDRADNVAIKLAGVEAFIRQKFYAFMARELAYDGIVTSGSANHIRRLKQNQGLPQEEWTQRDGNKWRGNESEIVKIRQIEWEVLQSK